ncbi:hypothetical protein [Leisingera sp. JC11]|uniref:hypothetical protein n=1 Tax=Leisingera sp. JC11 TaxID=3042469 RepID=UPI003451F6C0
MPMVKKTKLCQTLAAVLTVTVFHAQSGLAEESARSVSPGFLQAEQRSFGGEARTFAFGYGDGEGGFVFGGSLATGQNGPLTRAVQAEETHQLRLHAGYDFGPATGFVTLGGLQAEASGGRRRGPLFGFGMRVSLNRALQLTGEILHHEAGPKDGSASPRGETLAVSAAFRF